MTDFTEKVAAAGKSSVDVLFALANTAFDSSERLVALNLNTSRSLLDEGVANARALLAVKDVQELAKLQASFGQPLVNKAAGYARGAYEIVAQGQLARDERLQAGPANEQRNGDHHEQAELAPAEMRSNADVVESPIRSRHRGCHDGSCRCRSRRSRTWPIWISSP